MQNQRILDWDGCTNVRDLGGLQTTDGRQVRRGAAVRSDTPAKLTRAGWTALYEYGIRTIISLRTEGLAEDPLTLPEEVDGLEAIEVAIEDVNDLEFRNKWASSELWSTPLYYQDAIERWPKRHAAVFRAMVNAREGGVLFHCKRGVDRTGIISLLLLALLGVPDEHILADYVLSVDPERERLLEENGTNTREVILAALKGLDIESYLERGGMSAVEMENLKERLLE